MTRSARIRGRELLSKGGNQNARRGPLGSDFAVDSELRRWSVTPLGSRTCSLMNRRAFIQSAVAGATALALPRWAKGRGLEIDPAINAQIEKRHDEAAKRLQEWIRQPSIAAENRGINEGCDLTMRLLRDAGFGQVTKVPTD